MSSAVKSNLINDDDTSATSSPGFEDTLMRNLKTFKYANTDYEINAFANKQKLKGNIVEYNKEDFENMQSETQVPTSTVNNSENSRSSESEKNQTPDKNQTQENNTQENYQEYEPKKSKPTNKLFNTEEEEMLAKYDLLRQLAEMVKYRGVILTKKYTIDSSYDELLRERNLHKYIKDKHEGTRWICDAFLHGVKGLEYLNGRFDPFGFKLDGWTDQLHDDIGENYDTFGELYEKYVGTGVSIPPELKLGFLLCSSAAKFHYVNSHLSNLPNLDDKDNEQVRETLRQKAMLRKEQREQMQKKENESLEKAKTRVRDLDFINQRRKEREQEMDNKSYKSAQSQELRSRKIRNLEKIRKYNHELLEIEKAEEELKLLKSTSSRPIDTRFINKTPINKNLKYDDDINNNSRIEIHKNTNYNNKTFNVAENVPRLNRINYEQKNNQQSQQQPKQQPYQQQPKQQQPKQQQEESIQQQPNQIFRSTLQNILDNTNQEPTKINIDYNNNDLLTSSTNSSSKLSSNKSTPINKVSSNKSTPIRKNTPIINENSMSSSPNFSNGSSENMLSNISSLNSGTTSNRVKQFTRRGKNVISVITKP
ncbi:hypothetical protein Hokovirus_2_122 [Hokovirus HKV1]|uniref:Uncharacterized protein n=1 Tax=Hokovirus HKV1 TaxID=1977638 RepID=A0A1V0SFV1_9VIRU|nr:hypothetical protein Hokovirus_2_122 [Hokovirus HKV1]